MSHHRDQIHPEILSANRNPKVGCQTKEREREWRETKESGGGLVPAKSAARHAVPATSVTVVYCVQPKLSSIKEEKAEEAASKSMALNLLLVFLLYCVDPMNA